MNSITFDPAAEVAALFTERRRPRILPLAIAAAVVAHGVIAWGLGARAPTEPRREALALTATFITESPPAAVLPEPTPIEEPKPENARPRAAQNAKAAPAAAKAGQVLAANHAAPNPDDAPVEFVSDKDGKEFGSGVTAVGGTANHGIAGAVANGTGTKPVPASAPLAAVDAITPASDLSERVRVTDDDPCHGFFPSHADSDDASVSVLLVVRANGQVASARIVGESPSGQGFGQAARACFLSKHLVPALDRKGHPTTSAATIRVRFAR